MIDAKLIKKVVDDLNAIVKYLELELTPVIPPIVPPPPSNDLVTIPLFGNSFITQQWNSSAVGFAKVGKAKHRKAIATGPIPWKLTKTRAVPGVKTKLWSDARYDFSSILYFGIPEVRLRNGKPVHAHIQHNTGIDPIGGITGAGKQALRGGALGNAVISPYVTIRGHASGGTPEAPQGPLAMFWVAASVGYLNADGTSQIVAGRVPVDDMALFDEAAPDTYWKWVGKFPPNELPSHIVDGTFYDKDRAYFFLSDIKQGCIWKIDRGETAEIRKDPNNWTWTKFTTGLTKPSGIQDTKDGRLFVVDAVGLKEINITTGLATTVMPMTDSMFLRATSAGKLVVGDLLLRFVEYDPIAARSRVIHPGNDRGRFQWLTGDISPPAPHDYFVPEDTIMFVTGTGVGADGNNNNVYSLTLDGARSGFNGKVFDGQNGYMAHGLTASVIDPYGHYPWLWAFHPELSLVFSGGFGSSGITVLRPAQADDKEVWSYDAVSGGGAPNIIKAGSSGNFPFGVRPSMTNMWGHRWETAMGPTAQELVAMGKTRFAEYMRNGEWDGVKRPEFGELQIETLWYWVNACNYPGVANGAPMPTFTPPADKVAPVISSMLATRLDDSTVRITWTTNKPSIGFVELGQTSGVRYRAQIEDSNDYGLTHSATFKHCKAGRQIYFNIGAQSQAGYQAVSPAQFFSGI